MQCFRADDDDRTILFLPNSSDDIIPQDDWAEIAELAELAEEEDFSESFTAFVLKEKPINSTSNSADKLLFFYQFEELVELREHIREGFYS